MVWILVASNDRFAYSYFSVQHYCPRRGVKVRFFCLDFVVCGFLVRFFLLSVSLCFLACLSSLTDWCIAHRQQFREQKKKKGCES